MKPKAARKALILVAAVFALGALLPSWLQGLRADADDKAHADAPAVAVASDLG
jgi:hypothetical protein